MDSKEFENEPLAEKPITESDYVIDALMKGDVEFFKDLGGKRTETPRRRDAVSGKKIVPQTEEKKVSDQEDYGDAQDGFLPSLNTAEMHPNFYRNILKGSFEERLFRVLEREYPQMHISIQESSFPKISKAMNNFWEVRLNSESHRPFLDNLLLRRNVVLHVLEEASRPFMSKQYERLAETLEKEKKLPVDFAKRLIARAIEERLKDPVTASDPFHSERLKEELKGLPKPVSNEEMEEIIRGEIDVELKKYTQKK